MSEVLSETLGSAGSDVGDITANLEASKFENLSTIEKLEHLECKIADLLFEIDDIRLQINPRLEAEYATKIGYLENELLRTQIAARRSRRACALAQARTNAGESINNSSIQEQLDAEFKDWQEKLNKAIANFISVTERASGREAMSPADSKELRRLHKKLVKRLHPDLHPSQSEEERRFFVIVQISYEDGNIDMLRSIDVVTAWIDEEDYVSNLSKNEQEIELELRLAQVCVCEQQLDELKKSMPYSMKEKLESGKWVMQRTAELKAEIDMQKQVQAEYEQRFREISGVDVEDVGTGKDAGAKEAQ